MKSQIGGQYFVPAALQAAEAASLQPTPLGAGHAPTLLYPHAGHPPTAVQLQLAPTSAAVPLAFPPTGALPYTLPANGGGFQQPLAAYGMAQPALAAAAIAAAACGAGAGSAAGDSDLLYVNPKQLACILRRRKKRAEQEEKLHQLRTRQVWPLLSSGLVEWAGLAVLSDGRQTGSRCVAFLPAPRCQPTCSSPSFPHHPSRPPSHEAPQARQQLQDGHATPTASS